MSRFTTIALLLLGTFVGTVGHAPPVIADGATSTAATTTTSRPNVVFILADDLGWMDIEPNNPDCFYETPNLARLASTGLRMTRAYAACPVCSPTRASILTGKYPQRVGITDYINPNGGNQPEKWRRKTALLPAPFALELAHEEVTLAEILKNHGYATFFAGKWHLGSEGFFPEDQGFDVNKGGIERGGPYGGKKYFSPYGNARLVDGPEGEHLPDRLARETAAFIAEHEDQPFLAYLSFYSVHTPLMGRPDLVEKYEAAREQLGEPDQRWGQERARKVRLVQDHAVYAAMVHAMDEAVGVVLDAIDRHGLADNTIVVFFSDNGGLSTSEGHPTSNAPLRAGKGWLYEGGVREPCLIRVPGITGANTVCDHPIMSIDFLPTILELCGVDVGDDLEFDGISVAPLFENPDSALNRDAMYWHYPHYGNQGGAPSGAILADRWKLIEWYEDGSIELFHVSDDPGETQDVAVSHPERIASMRAQLQRWRESVDARMPTPNETHSALASDESDPVDATADTWPRFRGHAGQGISHATTIPARPTEQDFNWRVQLPGRGHSSPVIYDDRIFLTWIDQKTKARTLGCLSTKDGQLLWSYRDVFESYDQHRDNSFASSTPAVDENHVYCYWSSGDEQIVLAVDHDGEEVWKRTIGMFTAQWGTGSSPIVVDGVVIVANDNEGPTSFLAGLDAATGARRWRRERESSRASYATPATMRVNGKPAVVFASTSHGLTCLEVQTGSLLWEVDDLFRERCVASPVLAGDLVYQVAGSGTGGKEGVAVAMPAGNPGTQPEVRIELRGGIPYVPTPIAHDRWLFLWTDGGILSCIEASTGTVVWRERLGGSFYGSPVCIEGKLYCMSREGELFVVAAKDEFELLCRLDLGEGSSATPAVAGGILYLRTESRLISLGGDQPR